MPTACRYHRGLPSQLTREHASKRVSRLHRARLRAPGIIALLAALIAAPAGAHKKASEGPAVLAPGYAALEYAAPVAGTYALPALGPAANGRYLDSQAAAGELYDLFRDRVTVISFIYTQCDDVNGCPLATFVMGQMARRLQADPQIRKRLRLVSFSFDIDNDTPAALERYAQSFRPKGANWDFVTAPDSASLTRTLAAYQQSVQQSEGHAFAHILRVFLVDSDLRIRNIYSTAFLHADTLAADIKTVLLEQGDIESAGRHAAFSSATEHSSTAAADPNLGLPPPEAMNGPVPTAAQAALGEQLFFDRRLSFNRTISCAMCHIPPQGYAVNTLATAMPSARRSGSKRFSARQASSGRNRRRSSYCRSSSLKLSARRSNECQSPRASSIRSPAPGELPSRNTRSAPSPNNSAASPFNPTTGPPIAMKSRPRKTGSRIAR